MVCDMRERTVIISDTHLGPKHGAVRSADVLRPLWDGAAKLIVNGDVAEVHHPRHSTAAARQVVRLAELCETDGVTLRLISGNHDALLTDVRHIWMGHRFVLVTHGDAIHPAIAPWSPRADLLTASFKDALGKFEDGSPQTLERRLSAAQHAGFTEWSNEARFGVSPMMELLRQPSSIFKILSCWRQMPEMAAEFLGKLAPQARFIILGHTHREGIWPVNGRVVINTGSFGFPGHPRAVVIEGDMLSVWPIVWKRGGYRLGRKSLMEFDVTEPVRVHKGVIVRRVAA